MVSILLPRSLLLSSTKYQRLGRLLRDEEGEVLGWTLPLEVTENRGET